MPQDDIEEIKRRIDIIDFLKFFYYIKDRAIK